MRTIITGVFLLANLLVSAKTISDMAGRSVNIPEKTEKILPYDAKTSILLFPVANEKMVAKSLIPGSKNFQLIDESYNRMAEVDIKNIEEVLASNPQLIIAGAYISKESIERFDKLQKRTNIPVVIVDLRIDRLDQTYQFLGKLLGNETACNKCADYLKEVYKNTSVLKNSTSQKTDAVYYSIGGSGLMTDPSGSRHTEVLDYLNISNVAEVSIPTGGHAKVNMEQVLIWNPKTIFCAGFKGEKNAYDIIINDSRWQNIEAVKNHKVYKVPSQPFGWFDHPPTVNRIPGIIWLSQLFYGQDADVTASQIKTFYQLFYKYNLSETEYRTLFE
jgi:iron complex transport system substrate-binding protein